jgi:hypothetical protein
MKDQKTKKTETVNSNKFALEVEKLKSKNPDLSYLDCVIHFCEKYEIEIEAAGSILSKKLKELIKAECTEKFLLKKDTHTLL